MNVRIQEDGVEFETGRPVTFHFVRNTEKAPYFGGRFQQDIEPTGVYMVHNPDPGDLPRGWVEGDITFKNPLVVPFNIRPGNTYDEGSWKAVLSRRWRARKGALSRKLLQAGYDGIVTVWLHSDGSPMDTREIVALRR